MTKTRRSGPAPARDLFTQRHARCRDRLSPAFKRVADYIAANPIETLTLSALDLGRATGTSDATVVRAVQALGFDGLHDLRSELASAYRERSAPADNLARTWAEVGEDTEAAMDRVIASLSDALAALRDGPVRRAMPDALKILHVAERIAVFGVGPTAHIAAYFAARLRRKGRRQLVLDQMGTALADQLLELERGDALVMLAYGKPYPEAEAEATIFEARRLQIPVILLTDAPDEKPARSATVVLPVPRGRSGQVALHSATVACLEMLLLGLATTDRETAATALAELERLRETTGPARRAARTESDTEE
ncbi:MurR/RpiR family transcriptional regulator [Paracoccus sp. SJTW-4]|uniref:MurR/RpiR family transcriptional regulator n=1 Tax=Paracoccus sp. SJTW-4 TaxID=3078428 RepID=UPI0039E9B2B5